MMDAAALRGLEQLARAQDAERVYEALQRFSVRDVGELLLDVPASCPELRKVLPRMPSDAVQVSWTGNSGAALLDQSRAFVDAVSETFARLTRKPLGGSRILDYGCGWGRLIRLMYKFSGPDRIFGCDAWAASLDLCKEHGIRAHLALCDEVPSGVPFPGVTFDLVYAFSVLTHLSERTANAVVTAMRGCIDRHGMLAVTVRPPEYWDVHDPSQSLVDPARMKREHASRGFAFAPHTRPPVDGEVTYGDASISVDYIRDTWTRWSVAGERISNADPMQRVVFLRPA